MAISAAGIELKFGCAASGVNDKGLVEGNGESDHVTDAVGAVACIGFNARDGGLHSINHQIGIGSKGAGISWSSQGEDGWISSGIVDGAAIKGERC